MIPEFNENGHLPPGVHKATIEEVIGRFGHGSEDREACVQSLQWLLSICRQAGIARLILNGSFVTDRREPRDVDCALVAGDGYEPNSEADILLQAGLPYLSLEIVSTQGALDHLVNEVFGSDRMGRAKGLIEVLL